MQYSMFPLLFFLYIIWFISQTSANNSTKCSCVHGICREDTGDASNVSEPKCFCFNGYTGEDCSINFDECLLGRNPCQNNAICINDVPEAKCLCPAGFCGKYCEIEIDECQSNPCRNGGTCIDKVNGFECICPVGYNGLQCNIDIDACTIDLIGNQSNVRCYNGGTCKDGPDERYFCICSQEFTGQHCETMINPCDSSPCLNEGRCEKIANNNFKCICPYGWSGTFCHKKLKKCINNQCKNNALCMIEDDSYDQLHCFCSPDYFGKFCQYKFDECRPNNCQNGATCIDQINGYICSCPNGFAGSYCEINCLEKFDDSCLVPTTIIEPSISMLPSEDTLQITTPSFLSTLDTELKSSSLLLTNVTNTIIMVTSSSSIQPPFLIPDEIDVKNIHGIYSPSFDGLDSEIVFKLRRIKRASSLLKMMFISQNDNGTILYAYTTKYNLLIYLKNQNIMIELCDQYGQNLLHLESNTRIETFKAYLIKVTIISKNLKSLNMELSLFSEDQLIHSVNIQKNNLSVPCFEWFHFGQPPLENEKKLKPFKGCIFNIQLNNEERFVKDSFKIKNISECFSNVCQLNPCRNKGICQFTNMTSEQEETTTDTISWIKWNCSCLPGFRGWLCQEAYCDSEYCFNGGLCLLGELNKHLCICPQGFLGPRCEFKINLTFPSFNIGTNKSFIKYRLSYNIEEFFEIRFRFIAHPLEQSGGLLMFMSHIPNEKINLSEDFFSLIYEQRFLHLHLNLGQGEKMLKASTEPNMTEQMVLFGRFRQVFWLLVVPSGLETKLQPQVGRTPLHKAILNVDPYLYVGGHEDWHAHPALYNKTGFKGCIYDVEIRINRQSDFTRIEENLIDNLANIDQCDFECT